MVKAYEYCTLSCFLLGALFMYTLEDDNETSSRYKRDLVDPASPDDATAEKTVVETSDEALDEAPKSATTPPVANTPTKHITNSLPQHAQPHTKSDPAIDPRVALTALTIACIAVFFTALDQTVVVTALPQVISDLQIPFTQLDHAAWIISAYLLGFVVAMPLMGRVSDIYGRRRIFLLCLTIFGLGSILCGIAPMLGKLIDLNFLSAVGIDTSSPGLIWLIAARVFQAIGGGAVVPVAMAIAGDFYGQEKRGIALGIIGAVTEAGGAIGPLYGAVIVQHLGWQYIFYLNVPVVIVLLIVAWIFIPKGLHLREGIDWPGAILLALALTCLSLGLAQQGTSLGPAAAHVQAPQNNPIVLILAAVFLTAFILVERKVRWPVVELTTFKNFTFSAASLVSLLVGAALIIAMSDIPIYVDTVLQGPVLESGLALLRLTVMIPFGALLGGWLCSRLSCRLTGIVGLLFTAAGFFLMSRWPVLVTWQQMTISTMTAGFGFGLVIAPISTTAINSVRPTQAGMSSAVITALRMIGMMLGLAVLTSWALAYFRQLASLYPSLPATATAAQFTDWSKGYAAHLIQAEHTVYTTVFFISMIICLIALLPALFLWGRQQPVAEPELSIHDTPTVIVPAIMAADLAVAEPELANELPIPTDGAVRPGRSPRDKRRRKFAIISIAVVAALVIGGCLAEYFLVEDDSPDDTTTMSAPIAASGPNGNTPTNITSGPRMIQLAMNETALTSIFVSQLNLQPGVLSDLDVAPTGGDGLTLSLNLHIDSNGLHRVLPIALDGTIGLDGQHNLQLSIQHVRRDGIDAGPATSANMQRAMNLMLASAVMPALHDHLKGVKLISVHTSKNVACGKDMMMFVLQVEAPPIQGIAAQLTPIPLCFSEPIDLNKLLPQ
jgi:MFS family permease